MPKPKRYNLDDPPKRNFVYTPDPSLYVEPSDATNVRVSGNVVRPVQNKESVPKARKAMQNRNAFRKERPNVAAWNDAASAIPFVPLIMMGGEAAAEVPMLMNAANTIGTYAKGAKAIPWVSRALPWIETALAADMAGRGVTDVIHGNFTPETLFNLSTIFPAAYKYGKNFTPSRVKEHSYVNRAPIGYDGVVPFVTPVNETATVGNNRIDETLAKLRAQQSSSLQHLKSIIPSLTPEDIEANFVSRIPYVENTRPYVEPVAVTREDLQEFANNVLNRYRKANPNATEEEVIRLFEKSEGNSIEDILNAKGFVYTNADGSVGGAFYSSSLPKMDKPFTKTHEWNHTGMDLGNTPGLVPIEGPNGTKFYLGEKQGFKTNVLDENAIDFEPAEYLSADEVSSYFSQLKSMLGKRGNEGISLDEWKAISNNYGYAANKAHIAPRYLKYIINHVTDPEKFLSFMNKKATALVPVAIGASLYSNSDNKEGKGRYNKGRQGYALGGHVSRLKNGGKINRMNYG